MAGIVPIDSLKHMQALLLKEYKKLELQQMPEPEIGPSDVLIRVRACGICGSDVHGFDGSTGRRIPPIVMGHEAAGEVAALGANVTDLKIGDRVTFDSTIYCGECEYCVRGYINLCNNRQVLGVSPGPYRRHGAFAEYVAVPRRIIYRLPQNLSYEQAAMIEAVSVALHGVNLTPLKLGDKAVVVGVGMIGVLAVQALKAAGCSAVIAIDPDQGRLKMAAELGATETRATAPKAGEIDADIAIECVGTTEAIQSAITSVHKGGAVTLVGNVHPKIELPLQEVVTRQIRLQGSCASCGEYPVALDMLARGVIKVDGLISAVAPLTDGPEWFNRLYSREPNLIKVILQP